MPRQPYSPRPAPRPGGEVKKGKTSKTAHHVLPLTVPPKGRRAVPAQDDTGAVVKTIIVQDETGKIVSVTRVAPDARFGVGVKAKPGQIVREVETVSDARSKAEAAAPAGAGKRGPGPTRAR